MGTTVTAMRGRRFEPGSGLVQLHAIPPRGHWAAPVPASAFQQRLHAAENQAAATVAVVHDLSRRFRDKQPSNREVLERQAH
ncbi:hypothetical protein HaLaN_22747, partial [Haematococcus lacustris]